MKHIRIAAILFTLVFGILLSIRLGVMDRLISTREDAHPVQEHLLPDRDVWMNVFQADRKIGYAHSGMSKQGDTYRISEELFMRINTLGFAQDLNLVVNGTLSRDLTLSTFDVTMNSGVFEFSARGRIENNVLMIQTDIGGKKGKINIPVKEKPYLTAGVIQSVADSRPSPGETYTYSIFDPATMTAMPITVNVISREDIEIMNQAVPSTKIAIVYKGTTQYSWIDDNGDVLKEEGLLGMRLEKTSRQDALHGLPIQASRDMTDVASVASNVVFDTPSDLNILKVRISGIVLDTMSLEGGRQSVSKDLLTIQKEDLPDLRKPDKAYAVPEQEKEYLAPSPFIQSDHPDIIKTSADIISDNDTPFEKVRKVVAWVEKNIKKQPVLSLPDALSTLKNRVGDCNEHAVLTAALLRVAGIPARVESGLVYMDGRFYYHAWNSVYLGRWITVDSVFGQIPADVTHIRFSIGAQEAQIDLLNLVDRLQIEVKYYD